ncbi:uncharacterized protein DDB_G0284459-like [Argopecten irradians]|uniref:uncharacterized protein DDB_G0284459-like n=1 Tax=Argopecten irradians TaxID=31199 RepID=UPI00370F9C2D
MAETAASGMETPKEKKSRVLKRIKKKKQDLNISSTKKKKPFSYGRSNISLSTSIQKQSLRANNKALAFNLERTREALRIANDANLELQQVNQEQHMKLTTLQRVAGLKDEDIESEVKTRLKKHMSDLKTKMVSMRRLFYDAFACMDEVTDMCNSLSHRASQGQRGSSIGSSVGDTSLPHGAYEGLCRSLFSQISKQGFPSMLPSQTEPGPEASSAVTGDMSMIAETSVLLEDITPPSDLVTHIADIEEAENESKSPMPAKTGGNGVKLAPQRVLKDSNLTSPFNVGETEVSSPAVKNKKLDRRGTFVLSTNVADSLPSKSTLSKEESSETKSVKPVKNSSNKDQQREDSTRVDSSSKVLSSETKSPEICQKEATKSPKNTAKARSRSKGRLTRAESTTKACADSPSIPDRRKTFVLPKSVPIQEPKLAFSSKSSECLHPEKSLETAGDRRKTYLCPPAVSQSASNQSLSPNLGSFTDDVTQCFSMDMEMTEVIDSTQLIQLEKPEQNQQTLENSQSKPGKEIPKGLATESISLLPSSSDSSDSEVLSKPASVEFRIPRPGKIVFSASRKEVDGSRKPVPSKLPLKARSKSKIKLSRRKDTVPESPKEVKSIFDFHDRTPRGKEDSTKTSGSIYDLSMNESLRDPNNKPSLSQFRQNNDKGLKGKEGSKETDIKLLPNNPVYYQPLKECSPEPPVQKRSRSKSRTRKGESEDGNESRSSRARSRSRRRDETESTEKKDENVPKSRARSRSRRRDEAENTEKDDEVENIPKSRARSRSRRRDETESIENDEEVENIPKSRGRSRSRRRGETESTEKDEVEKILKSRARSRSRRRGETESTEKDDEVEKILKSRARSRSRRRDETESTENDDEDGTGPRPRGRTCKRSAADVELDGTSVSVGDEIEADRCTSTGRSRTIRRNYAEDSDDSEENKRKAHSQSKNRKTDDEYKIYIKPRTRSRSRCRKETQEDTIETERNAVDVMKEADSGSSNKLPQIDISPEGHRSRSRSIKRKTGSDDNDGSEIRSLKNRTRSRSRHRKNLMEGGKIEDDSSGGTVESRDLVTTESNVVIDINCPGREDDVTRTSNCGDDRSTSRSRSKERSNKEEEDEKSRGRSRSRRRKNTVDLEIGTPISTKKSESLHVEDTPDMALRKSRDVDGSENKRKEDFQQSRSRAQSRTRKNKEREKEGDGEDFQHETGSRKKVLKQKQRVLISDSDDDNDDVVKKVSKRSEIPVSEPEAVPASSGDEKSEEDVPKSEELNLPKPRGDGVMDDDVEVSIIIVPSPPKSIKLKAKKKLSLNKKVNSSKSSSSDMNRISDTGESEDTKESDAPSDKKCKDANNEIPHIADGLFVTKRGRSLKSGRQTADDHDLDIDFDCLSHNNNMEISKLPKTPSQPASDGGTKSTASPQLKKLKSVKKSSKKRCRSNRNSLSEDPKTSLLKTPATDTEHISDKENDRSGLGITEQLQNIRKRLASLDKRQSKSSLGSQPVPNSYDFSKLDMGSNEPETKRPRRGAAPVSLKEMSLNQKMRREDFEVPKSTSKPSSNTSTPLKKKL